jgi:cytochrome c551/c552
MRAPDRQYILPELFSPSDENGGRAMISRLLPQPLPIDQPADNHKPGSRQRAHRTQASHKQNAKASCQTDASGIRAIFRPGNLCGVCHSPAVKCVVTIAYRQLTGKLDTKCKFLSNYLNYVIKNLSLARFVEIVN